MELINGFAAEMRMTTLSKELFLEWDNKPTSHYVIEAVKHFKPGYVKKVMNTNFKEQGFSKITEVPFTLLCDGLLGIDNVLGIKLNNGKIINIGVDVTVWDEVIANKLKKLNDFQPQLRAVGINGCLVIKWEVYKFPHEWTEADKKIMRKQILDALFSSNVWVKSLTLTL